MNIREFQEKVAALPRDEIIDLIRQQDPELVWQINRIEGVFRTKLRHLNWEDGTPVTERDLTNEELALIVDPPFRPSKELRDLGLSVEEQRQVHIASDPVLWAKHVLGVKPRVYQTLMLRHPKKRKVLRAGRRLGKTWTMAVMLLHYASTAKNGRCLVMAPMKSHVGLIYDEVMALAKNSQMVYDSIVRNVTSPQYEIAFSTGATIRFFTTGLKSGGKSDVARGQEAHLIVLDEMDYMGTEDLDALYAMLQKTDENQPDKVLVGASTPSGQRGRFWEWNKRSNTRFASFWFPSYVNPYFDKAMEEELREEHTTEMAYRHEVEADWGEDVEGVYPRRYIDAARQENWKYVPTPVSARCEYLIGVDWDKYGAGPNIVVLEACEDHYEDERFAGKLRVIYRKEIPRSEYVLTEAVDEIINLNAIFSPKWIYVDQGYGEVQAELLHKHGLEHPESGLKRKVKSISFQSSFEMRDPATRQVVKKPMKPFMVDNLRTLFEQDMIRFPNDDEELYLQLISYVVTRTSALGQPVFGSSGTALDHAHDALMLAALAYTENYGELHKTHVVRAAKSISNEPFLPMFTLSENEEIAEKEKEVAEEVGAPLMRRRAGVPRRRRRSTARPIARKMF